MSGKDLMLPILGSFGMLFFQSLETASAAAIRWQDASQINALVLLDLSLGLPPPPAAKSARAPKIVWSLDDCNLTGDSPSTSSFGSMPLGNGDVGANLWLEENAVWMRKIR